MCISAQCAPPKIWDNRKGALKSFRGFYFAISFSVSREVLPNQPKNQSRTGPKTSIFNLKQKNVKILWHFASSKTDYLKPFLRQIHARENVQWPENVHPADWDSGQQICASQVKAEIMKTAAAGRKKGDASKTLVISKISVLSTLQNLIRKEKQKDAKLEGLERNKKHVEHKIKRYLLWKRSNPN